MNKKICIAFAGNANCGKTTLFNAYTGAKLKVANWPGVTVEKKEGRVSFDGNICTLVDLPGVYSLDAYTIEERVTREYLLGDEADVIVNVADGSNLARNLYLTLQLRELGKPMVLALNMMDIVYERGTELDINKLSDIVGVPVIAVSARTGEGLKSLLRTAVSLCGTKVKKIFRENKYTFIDKILPEITIKKGIENTATDKADRILMHRYLGVPIFLFVMAAVFFLTFTVGGMIKSYFEGWLESFSVGVRELLRCLGASGWTVSLITDGIISGVGGVLTFLPNIFILFLLLAVLEDSGYMSRVAYVMDSFMSRLGLSGRAYIPMMLGFGCSVPAIMATRTLDNISDRRRVMAVIPFMSCSARMPIYILLSDIFFGRFAAVAAFSMYIIGVFVAVGVLVIMPQKRDDNDLLIELPEYKMPSLKTVLIYVWEKVCDYLAKAGTTIFIASVILWFVLNFNMYGMTARIDTSFAAMLGKTIAPLLNPAGLGLWQIAVALLSGIAAKEVVVSSLGVLFGVTNVTSADGMAAISTALANEGFGAVNAYSMMLFCLLYVPCIATIAIIKKETQSSLFTLKVILLQFAVAWIVSVLYYQIASLV
ncbi:MAG: ferrous iron transport protein B [Clostridia bacterium]|nr:ferrous iron transport protein B [Clostridia bacterium]